MDYDLIEEKVLSGLTGFATGDAMGVPIEFTTRAAHQKNPLREMVGFGTHNVPRGTWSDDTSMTIATMDSINEKNEIDYDDIMKKYCLWAVKAKYTATNDIFDIGNATRKALSSYIKKNTSAVESGGKTDRDNGNGSLMRMLPIVYYLYYKNIDEEKCTEIIDSYSSMTHAHPISKLGCHIYYDFMKSLLDGKSKEEAFDMLKNNNYVEMYGEETVSKYSRILDGSLKDVGVDDISSSGYVVNTLEASLWTLLHTDNYEDAVVTAINLGLDTDTVGAVTGSMAGVLYGYNQIPKRWTDYLIKKEYIEDIGRHFTRFLSNGKGMENPYREDDVLGFSHDEELYRMVTGGYQSEQKTDEFHVSK